MSEAPVMRETPPPLKKSFYNWLSSINIYFFLLRFIFFLKNSKWAIILASIFHLQFYVLKINCNILINKLKYIVGIVISWLQSLQKLDKFDL